MASYAGKIAPPGYPKTSVTPSRTRHSHRICAPVSFIAAVRGSWFSVLGSRSRFAFALRRSEPRTWNDEPEPRTQHDEPRTAPVHYPVTAPTAADETSFAYF